MISLSNATESGIMVSKKELLGLRIREFRERRNLTQDKLAEKIGIDPKHLSRIENGRNYPSLDTLEKLVTSLDVTLDSIFKFNHISTNEDIIERIELKLKSMPIDKLKFISKMIDEL